MKAKPPPPPRQQYIEDVEEEDEMEVPYLVAADVGNCYTPLLLCIITFR